jgi:glutamine synthetase
MNQEIEIKHLEVSDQNSAVGTATCYGLNDRGGGVRVPVGSRIFSSTRRPNRLWGPPNLLSNGYKG